jgi:DNA-binding NtrC family response regulator
LVVDDEKLIRKTAKRILEKCGYDVIAAEDGEKGVKLFQEKHDQIRAVVLDMIMSDMSGKEAFTRMIEIDPKVNVILASGFRQDERVQEVMQLGVKSFIHKPYTMEKLTQAVNEAL